MRQRSGPSLQVIAYHEAGHAAVCWYEGIEVALATIVPDAGSLGRVSHRSALGGIDLACDDTPQGKARAESLVRMALAGPLAQRRINPRGFRYDNSRGDYKGAQDVLSHLVGPDPEEMTAYLRLLEIQTRSILTLDIVWARVERIAAALLDLKTLSAEELEDLVDKN